MRITDIFFIPVNSYSVKDMYGERKYIVNMNMSFCFESSGACFLTFSILSDTLLPKALCSWENTPGELNFNMSITF